jgi:cob(I)alamin adenosyltransferase
MVVLSSIVTKGGDKGKTSLGDGQRVSKGSLRIDAIGNVDELNAAIGLLCEKAPDEIKHKLRKIQNNLFDLGADLCVTTKTEKLKVQSEQVDMIEQWVEEFNRPLPPLTSFILPGGCEASAMCHYVRTIARRAERSVVKLSEEEEVNPIVIQYLNRLSDIMFIWARFLNQYFKQPDVLWIPGN